MSKHSKLAVLQWISTGIGYIHVVESLYQLLCTSSLFSRVRRDPAVLLMLHEYVLLLKAKRQDFTLLSF